MRLSRKGWKFPGTSRGGNPGSDSSAAHYKERAATLGRTWTVKGKVTDSDGSGYLHDDDDCHDDHHHHDRHADDDDDDDDNDDDDDCHVIILMI